MDNLVARGGRGDLMDGLSSRVNPDAWRLTEFFIFFFGPDLLFAEAVFQKYSIYRVLTDLKCSFMNYIIIVDFDREDQMGLSSKIHKKKDMQTDQRCSYHQLRVVLGFIIYLKRWVIFMHTSRCDHDQSR